MNTYSDALNPIRVFLEPLKPVLLDQRTEYPKAVQAERWLVQETEIILRIQPGGTWDVFVPVSTDPLPLNRITALERYLLGRQRPDLDTLADMGNICDLFLDRLAEIPACSDPHCGQLACEDSRNLRQTVRAFKARLFPPSKEKSNVST
jgi:hypothetical protein